MEQRLLIHSTIPLRSGISKAAGSSTAEDLLLLKTPLYAGWQEHTMKVATSDYREGFFSQDV